MSEVAEVAPALIAVHPLENSVAVSVGSDLRVFDLTGQCPVTLEDDKSGPCHSDAIRAICFSARGGLFASGGDDKLVKIWSTKTWRCLKTLYSEKRVSAIAINNDETYLTFADKFGIVWVFGLEGGCDDTQSNAVILLGHYCSIITSLEFSPYGKFIASADRDFKIRISNFPKYPLNGAHEIQSFCLGHTDYISCLIFVLPPNYGQGFLLSGSGDSTVRLWDFISGDLLFTFEVGKMAEISSGDETKHVICMRALSDGSLVAVAAQGLHGIILLRCEFRSRTLSVAQVVPMGEGYVPSSLALSSLADNLWTLMGVSNLPNAGVTPQLTFLRVISGLRRYISDTCREPWVLEDDEVPGGQQLLMKLQGSVDVAKDRSTLVVTAKAMKLAACNLLNKKQYSTENREFRKIGRNDRKFKH